VSNQPTNEDLILLKLGTVATHLSSIDANTENLSDIKDYLKEIRSLLEELLESKKKI